MADTNESRAMIEVGKLAKAYGLMPVLKGLDLEVTRGQFVALLGPNGSGKSTLLRMLAGLSKPTAGTIQVGGWKLPEEAAAVRAQIGMVSHKPLLYDALTAYENLSFFGRLYNIPEGDLDERIRNMLARVGLEKRADSLARTFSRGMQQRLTIARALLHEPHVLLMDEPYTGLDQQAAGVLDSLLEVADSSGEHTIVMATHQLDRAAKLSSRVVMLARGKVAYDRPAAGLDTLALAADYADVTGQATARQ